jgi:CheY-like chemotaxis protein
LLGGHFHIDSSPGRGTRITLIAPRAAAPDAVAAAAASGLLPPEPPAGSKDDGRSGALRILIVDDHGAMRNAVREMLQDRRELLVVGEAANGVEGIAQAHALRPDVILMDVAMPHMDGVEATRRIHKELPSIIILGLSTHSRDESADAMQQAGAAEFFVKGIDTGRLIDYLVGEHSARMLRSSATP